MLIVFGGLPGVGKTTIARELSGHFGAMHLRIDSIEQAIRDSGMVTGPINEVGYLVAYAIAQDNLLLGRTVIADCVNPLQVTRDAWLAVACKAGVGVAEVEVTCSDAKRHRQRLEVRPADIGGLRLTWEDVVAREYEPWNGEHIVIDTSRKGVSEIARELREALAMREGSPRKI